MGLNEVTQVVNRETLVDFGVADDMINGLRGRLMNLEADTPAGYEAVRAGIAEVRSMRTGVERSRKELKQSALDWGRKVDAEAKRVTDLLLEIEDPLKLKKKEIDSEKERIKEEKIMAAKREEQEKLRAEQEKRDAQQRAERERLEAERKVLEEERRIEREKLEEQRRVLEEERAALEAEKAERVRKDRERALAEAKKKAEAEQAAREKREAKERAEREEEERLEQERLAEERKPDCEKLRDFAKSIVNLESADMTTSWGQEIKDDVEERLFQIGNWVLEQVGDDDE